MRGHELEILPIILIHLVILPHHLLIISLLGLRVDEVLAIEKMLAIGEIKNAAMNIPLDHLASRAATTGGHAKRKNIGETRRETSDDDM